MRNDQVSERRFVSWGHWGISFWTGEPGTASQAIAEINFPVGSAGPMDGCIGSAERRAWQLACTAWVDSAELPSGAHCPIDAAWMHDPSHPAARWVESVGWVSAARVGRDWVFPSVAA